MRDRPFRRKRPSSPRTPKLGTPKKQIDLSSLREQAVEYTEVTPPRPYEDPARRVFAQYPPHPDPYHRHDGYDIAKMPTYDDPYDAGSYPEPSREQMFDGRALRALDRAQEESPQETGYGGGQMTDEFFEQLMRAAARQEQAEAPDTDWKDPPGRGDDGGSDVGAVVSRYDAPEYDAIDHASDVFDDQMRTAFAMQSLDDSVAADSGGGDIGGLERMVLDEPGMDFAEHVMGYPSHEPLHDEFTLHQRAMEQELDDMVMHFDAQQQALDAPPAPEFGMLERQLPPPPDDLFGMPGPMI